MRSPIYVVLSGTTPKIINLDVNNVNQQIAVRAAAGVTVEVALEDPDDFVAGNSYDPPAAAAAIAGGLAGPSWQAAPAAVNGIINIVAPIHAIRLTPTTGGVCTILQSGLI